MKSDKEAIRRRALEFVAADGRRVASRVASEFGVSRQVANGYLQAMVHEGLIQAEGSTRARVYGLETLVETDSSFSREGLNEDVVWRETIAPVVDDLPENVRDIWNYVATEMINNAIDHSGAAKVRVRLRRNALFCELLVADDGEGIFLKIQRALGLHDAREAILELAKGKLTTAPEAHSGEGIFFTSKVVDAFDIHSTQLRFRHDQGPLDVLAEHDEDAPGTMVVMQLDNDSSRTLQEVFDAFSDPEEYTFDKTVVPVRLAQYGGEKLVSRSQAKRIAHRFERFKRVELDFADVSRIGQAFADELFRVFAKAHPEIRLTPINTEPTVANMIKRAVSARRADTAAG